MKTYNDSYQALHEQRNRSPKFTARVDFTDLFDDDAYITSHADSSVPAGKTVIARAIKNGIATSQELKEISSIGGATLEIVDIANAFTDLLRTKLAAGKGLRLKRVQISKGFAGLDWANYELFQTYVVGKLSYHHGTYFLHCEDIQRIAKDTKIFTQQETTLLATLSATATEFKVTDATDFKLLEHGTSYSDAPAYKTGTVSATNGSPTVTGSGTSWTTTALGYGNRIEIDGNEYTIKSIDSNTQITLTGNFAESTASGLTYIAYPRVCYVRIEDEKLRARGFVETPNVESGTDISFSAADNSINATTTDLSGYSPGQIVTISGSAANSGDIVAATVSATKITTATAITTESAGPTITLAAPSQFFGCTRGVLNTKAVQHDVDVTVDPNRRTKVTEEIYIEMPVGKLIYGVLLGVLYGQTGEVFPWSAELDAEYVAVTEFTGIGADIWDPTDDTRGLLCRFEGLEEIDIKKFIEEELLTLIGCHMPVRRTGEWGLARRTVIAAGATPVAILNNDAIASHTALVYDYPRTRNMIRALWNWSSVQEDYTRTNTILYAQSRAIYKKTAILEMRFKGLHGSRHTEAQLARIIDMNADRFAWPPITTSAELEPWYDVLENGDIVSYEPSTVRDHTGDGATIQRAMEVQGTTIDLVSGQTTVKLMGSSAKEPPQGALVASTVLADSFYENMGGTNINTLTNYTNTGGVGHITGDETLTGNAVLTSGVWYHLGDLTIDAGVTLTITDNVLLIVRGHRTCNGKIDGKGRGVAGGTTPASNTKGGFGTATSAGGLALQSLGAGLNILARSTPGIQVIGTNKAAVPYFNLEYDGANTIYGIPPDGRGCGGPVGGDVYETSFSGSNILRANGGDGGDGGACLWEINRGASFGASGSIDLSGDDGQLGEVVSISPSSPSRTWDIDFRAGSGAGASPGSYVHIVDGVNSVIPDLDGKFIANTGKTPVGGTSIGPDGSLFGADIPGTFYSYYIGNGDTVYDASEAAARTKFIYQNETAQADPNDEKPLPITGLAFTTGTATLITHTDGTLMASARLTWTPSTDPKVKYYYIFYKKTADTRWIKYGDQPLRSDGETEIFPLEDQVAYDFRVVSINVWDAESDAVEALNKTVIGKSANPTALTGFSTSSQYGAIRLIVTEAEMPDDKDLSALEIWYSSINDRNSVLTANKITEPCRPGSRKEINHVVPSDIPIFYWIRTKDTSAKVSAFYPSSATSGIPGIALTNKTVGWRIDATQYFGDKLIIDNEIRIPTGIHISSDGSRLYIIGADARVHQYSLKMPWILATAAYDVSFSVSAQDSAPNGLFFKGDGTKFYITGATGDSIYQYSLSTAWDLTTASYDSVSFSISTQTTSPKDLYFKDNGLSAYVLGNDKIFQYTLSTAWNISTASYASKSVDLSSEGVTGVTGLAIFETGDGYYLVDDDTGLVNEYEMSTAWDISTSSIIGGNLNIRAQQWMAGGIFVNSVKDKLYIVGERDSEPTVGSAVHRIDVDTPGVPETGRWGLTSKSYRFSGGWSLWGGALSTAGNKMYAFYSGTSMRQYSLTVPWDIATLTYDSVTFTTSISSPLCAKFSRDGSKMYVLGQTGVSIYQFSLSTPWVLSTASSDSKSVSVSAQDSAPKSFRIDYTGTRLYVLGQTNRTIYQYTLSTAWDISTASYASKSLSLGSTGSMRSLELGPRGERIFVLINSKVKQFNMSTAWDLSTASLSEFLADIWEGDEAPNEFQFSEVGDRFYVFGTNQHSIKQYNCVVRSG